MPLFQNSFINLSELLYFLKHSQIARCCHRRCGFKRLQLKNYLARWLYFSCPLHGCHDNSRRTMNICHHTCNFDLLPSARGSLHSGRRLLVAHDSCFSPYIPLSRWRSSSRASPMTTTTTHSSRQRLCIPSTTSAEQRRLTAFFYWSSS